MARLTVSSCLLGLLITLAEHTSVVQSASCDDVQQGVVLGVGADVRHGPCASQEECCAACDAAGDCVAWTFHSSGPFANVCLQHSSASPQRKDNTAVSGLAGPFRGKEHNNIISSALSCAEHCLGNTYFLEQGELF